MIALTETNYLNGRNNQSFQHPSNTKEAEDYNVDRNLNGLKQTQLKFAPTRRQKIIEKRRSNFQIKAKTELCKYFLIRKACPKGENCAFAHGEEDLRAKPIANYRTAKCRHFQEKGWCQYGPRCQFQHNVKAKEIPKVKMTYGLLLQAVQDDFNLNSFEETDLEMDSFFSKRSSVEAYSLPKLIVFNWIRGSNTLDFQLKIAQTE